MKNANNVMDTLIENQKKAMDKATEATKKVYGSNAMTEAMEKGSEMYNEWMNKQKAAFETVTEKAEDAQTKNKEAFSNAQTYFQNWLEGQQNMAKNMWEMNQNFLKGFAPNTENMSNPMAWFQNNAFSNMWTDGMKNYNNFINQGANNQKWFELMNQYNPFNMAEKSKNWFSNTPNFFNAYYEVLNKSIGEFQKMSSNGNMQDFYGNLANNAAGFGKFVEIWAPFWKSIQDNTFNAEAFKNSFNMEALKDLTDNMFNMLPETVQNHFTQMTAQSKEAFKSFTAMNKEQWNQAKAYFNNNNPLAQYNPFVAGAEQYTQFAEWFKGAVSPLAKMTTPNQYTKSIAAWSDISDKMAIYLMKNAELQYMMYQQSGKVMETLTDKVVEKIEKNEKIESLTALYQEWLNTGDAVYVQLFESDTYSKLMAEVSAMQLKLKKEIDGQMEQAISQYPIATKSELDELYKIIYDLKKEVRQLEKMMEFDAVANEDANAAKTTAKKTTKK